MATPDFDWSVFLDLCRAYDGVELSLALQEQGGLAVARMQEHVAEQQQAAAAIADLPPAGAALLAILLGSAVENGADPLHSVEPLMARFLAWLPSLPVLIEPDAEDEEGETEYPEPTPEQSALLEALPMFCQGLVAHLVRAPQARARWAADALLLQRLEALSGYSHAVVWIQSLLQRSSGALVVLHPGSRRGFKLRYENVGACFHLFSLIQIALGTSLPEGREPDPDVVDSALYEYHEDSVGDQAWWHYGDPYAPEPNVAASIWGEALVTDLPKVDGIPVILLWPLILNSRSWDAGFFGPSLAGMPPNVELEAELTPAEYAHWQQRLKL